MQILEQSSTRLRLREIPFMLWGFGLIFVAAGLVVMLSSQLSELDCRRVEPTLVNCTLARASVFGLYRTETQLNGLTGADLESTHGSKGSSYRVRLQTRGGPVALTGYYSSGYDDKRAFADRVNAQVQDPAAAAFQLQQDGRWEGLFGLFFVVPGLLIALALGQIVTVDFDRNRGTVLIQRYAPWGRQREEHPLSAVAQAEVVDGHSRKGRTFRIQLVLRSGEQLPFTSYYSSGRGGKQKTVDAIQAWLGEAAGNLLYNPRHA